jgi:hemerythrin-like domain-containing protein
MHSAIKILLEDHERFRSLFRELEETEIFNSKIEIFRRLATELKAHSALEEELFYPAVRKVSEQDDLVDESIQEHHVIDLLLAELEGMNPSDEAGQHEFTAKLKVLKENVEHHVEEEELEMFPKAEECGVEGEQALSMSMQKFHESTRTPVR